MPREQINYPSYPGDTAPRAHIVWNQNVGHVQLAFEMDEASVMDWLKDKTRLTDADGKVWFYTQVLDRQVLNKLIRTARTARDKAYGRDQ